jgi:hypothetical protein
MKYRQAAAESAGTRIGHWNAARCVWRIIIIHVPHAAAREQHTAKKKKKKKRKPNDRQQSFVQAYRKEAIEARSINSRQIVTEVSVFVG